MQLDYKILHIVLFLDYNFFQAKALLILIAIILALFISIIIILALFILALLILALFILAASNSALPSFLSYLMSSHFHRPSHIL